MDIPVRKICVKLHRYAGLASAPFLLIAGLTGSVLAFNQELDAWLNPELFRAPSRGATLPPAALIERLEQDDARVKVLSAPLQFFAGKAVRLRVRPRLDPDTGKPFELDFDELFADPVDGSILGHRLWGACCLEHKNLVPFLYRLHYSLLIPGNAGIWLMGSVALTWMFDTLIAAYLTLPLGPGTQGRSRPIAEAASPRRSWWQRWGTAWRIKRGAGAGRFQLDLHRAGGLWLFGLLLAVALSGMSFNLREAVFEPALALVSPLSPSPFDARDERAGDDPLEPKVGWAEILHHSETEAAQRGLNDRPASIFYNPAYGIYGVAYGNEADPDLGPSYLYFDWEDGRFLGDYDPRKGSAGDIFSAIQLPLHSGRIAGLPGRVAISATGLAVALLSVTGVLIWRRKCRARGVRIAPQRRQCTRFHGLVQQRQILDDRPAGTTAPETGEPWPAPLAMTNAATQTTEPKMPTQDLQP